MVAPRAPAVSPHRPAEAYKTKQDTSLEVADMIEAEVRLRERPHQRPQTTVDQVRWPIEDDQER